MYNDVAAIVMGDFPFVSPFTKRQSLHNSGAGDPSIHNRIIPVRACWEAEESRKTGLSPFFAAFLKKIRRLFAFTCKRKLMSS